MLAACIKAEAETREQRAALQALLTEKNTKNEDAADNEYWASVFSSGI